MKSSHELLDDPKLSKANVIDPVKLEEERKKREEKEVKRKEFKEKIAKKKEKEGKFFIFIIF